MHFGDCVRVDPCERSSSELRSFQHHRRPGHEQHDKVDKPRFGAAHGRRLPRRRWAGVLSLVSGSELTDTLEGRHLPGDSVCFRHLPLLLLHPPRDHERNHSCSRRIQLCLHLTTLAIQTQWRRLQRAYSAIRQLFYCPRTERLRGVLIGREKRGRQRLPR